MSTQRSIVIGGGAFAGLALALALRQGLGRDVAIIVADPALGVRPSRDPRATAIVAACRRLFEAIGARSEEHTSESSHVKISYAVFCLKKKKKTKHPPTHKTKKTNTHTQKNNNNT